MSDNILAAALLAVGVGLIAYGLRHLDERDKLFALRRLCPPHKWERRNDDQLHCGKCKRKVGNVTKNGWSTPSNGGYIG